MLKIIPKIPLYYSSRMFGFPQILPINLTLSVSYKCDSRCKTCNIYKKKVTELALDEWQRIFSSVGKDLFWATISGGEPFLKNDLVAIVCSLYDHCQPAIINIPTNGILNENIPQQVKKIASYCEKTQIVINVSIDDIEERHDIIRGVSGSYEKANKTFFALKALKNPNLSVGIHTVISKFNVNRIPEIYNHIQQFNPDSYITEIAEERVELDTVGAEISPGYMEYEKAINFLTKKIKQKDFKKIGKITHAFRMEYYKTVKQILKKRTQLVPCYAGVASAQIAPDGDVWACCVKAESMGNLRDAEYDLKKIFFAEKAKFIRNKIKEGKCFCPLANTSYTNMLFSIKSLCRVGLNLV